MLTGSDSCIQFFLFPGVMPPRGGNGKHCSVEKWLNYSIFTSQKVEVGYFNMLLLAYEIELP